MVFRRCSVSRWCLGVALLVRSCLGRVPVVSQWCPGRVPWCPGGVAVCPVVSRWLVPQSCPGGVAVASRGVPVVSSGVQWCPGGWDIEGVPVLLLGVVYGVSCVIVVDVSVLASVG